MWIWQRKAQSYQNVPSYNMSGEHSEITLFRISVRKRKIVFFHTTVTVRIVLNYDRRGQERRQQKRYLVWVKIFFPGVWHSRYDSWTRTVPSLWPRPCWPLGPGLCSKKRRECCVTSLLSLVSREAGEKDTPLKPVFSSASEALQKHTQRERRDREREA